VILATDVNMFSWCILKSAIKGIIVVFLSLVRMWMYILRTEECLDTDSEYTSL